MATAILTELDALIGEKACLKLVSILGGCTWYVCAHNEAYQRLAKAIGEDSALLVVQKYLGETIYIPKNDSDAIARVRADMAELKAQGYSLEEISRMVQKPVSRYSTRHIRNIINNHNQHQDSLF